MVREWVKSFISVYDNWYYAEWIKSNWGIINSPVCVYLVLSKLSCLCICPIITLTLSRFTAKLLEILLKDTHHKDTLLTILLKNIHLIDIKLHDFPYSVNLLRILSMIDYSAIPDPWLISIFLIVLYHLLFKWFNDGQMY